MKKNIRQCLLVIFILAFCAISVFAQPAVKVRVWNSAYNHYFTLAWPEADSANRMLNFTLAGEDRSLSLAGDFTLSGSNQVANWTATTAVYSPSIYGGTGVDGDLNLYSTSNATRGTVTVNDPIEIPSTGRNLKTWWNFEEFIQRSVTASISGIWAGNQSGTGATSSDQVGTNLRPGLNQLTTGTTATGYAYLYTGGAALGAFLFGNGTYTMEGDIYIGNLSDVTETYTLRFGFGDSGTGTPVDGAYFYYTDAGANPNWYRNTVSNSVLTSTDTTVAAVAGAWIRLKVVVNLNATSVEYFINGTSVGSNVANIPSGAGRNTAAIYSLIKSAGTTSRYARIDWAWLHIDLTASR